MNTKLSPQPPSNNWANPAAFGCLAMIAAFIPLLAISFIMGIAFLILVSVSAEKDEAIKKAFTKYRRIATATD